MRTLLRGLYLAGFLAVSSPCLADDAALGFKPLKQADVSALALKDDQIVVVQAWASWCASCSSILPLVDDVVKASGGRARIVTVSVDDDEADALGYLRKHAALFEGRKLAAFVDAGAKRLESYGVKGVPATLVFRGQGKPEIYYGFENGGLMRALATGH